MKEIVASVERTAQGLIDKIRVESCVQKKNGQCLSCPLVAAVYDRTIHYVVDKTQLAKEVDRTGCRPLGGRMVVPSNLERRSNLLW